MSNPSSTGLSSSQAAAAASASASASSSSSSTAATTTSSMLAASSAAVSLFDSVSVWMFRFGAVLVGLVAVAGGLLYAKQESLLYLPTVQGQIPRRTQDNPSGYRTPTEHGVKQWFNVRIPTADGTTIHAWYLIHPHGMKPNSNTTSTSSSTSLSTSSSNVRNRHSGSGSAPSSPVLLPTILFFHGNAGNIGLRLPNAVQMMHHLTCHVLLVEYRGYGDSDDQKPPTEVGLKLDAQAAYQWISTVSTTSSSSSTLSSSVQVEPSTPELSQLGVASVVDPSKLFVFGRSLGGAVAFSLADYVATQQSQPSQPPLPPLAGLIVENTFLNISAMVDRIFPFLKAIKPFVLRLDWNSHKLAATLLSTPILYLAGAKDELVPLQHMQTLYQTSLLVAGNPNTVLHVIPNGTHNESWYKGGRDYWKAIQQFMIQHSSTSSLSSRAARTTASATTTSEEPTTTTAGSSSSTAIPTMSQNIMDMAKGAFASSSTTVDKNKKKS